MQNNNSWKVWIWKNKYNNAINFEPDIDKTSLYAKDPYKAKYQLLSNKRESAGLKYLNVSSSSNTQIIWN